MEKSRALIAMSGGVDSSVAAAFMIEAGYDCAGATLGLFDETLVQMQGFASNEGDAAIVPATVEAQEVCKTLGIPHHYVDVSREFTQLVVEPFVAGYLGGSTPNPCIFCNQEVKFGILMRWALQEGYEVLATGHYARILDNRLLKAVDNHKDQSYVLYGLKKEQLKQLRLPLGDHTKEEIRTYAQAHGFANAQKPESQDICFVPKGNYYEFIEAYLQQKDQKLPPSGGGFIVTTGGAVVGEHKGVHRYTIGQRRGLAIAGPKAYYVAGINASTAQVVVAHKEALGKSRAYIAKVNLFCDALDLEGQTIDARHRYRGREHKAIVHLRDDHTALVVFDEEQHDLAPGQALVFYDGQSVLGGGTIIATE
ncbi:MAG: tRNA 2-thiouridine(34) synthase MnmA [Coriobacteriia bacterium]|nr:tRNA 2-thiouridine(34) synthase MnmA [Coriobacteriia bacterium]